MTPKEAFSSQFSAPAPARRALVDRFRGCRGGQGPGRALGPGSLVIDGELKKATGGGGTSSPPRRAEPFNPPRTSTAMPERSGEVALLATRPRTTTSSPGSAIGVATAAESCRVTVVGAYDLGSANAGGTDIVSAPLADIQRWFDRRGRGHVDQRRGRRGRHARRAGRADRAVVPAGGREVRHRRRAAEETAADINDQIGGFLTPALLAFAGAALLVGAFIIFNTFTITVAERTREFALLRTLGATRARSSAPSPSRRSSIGAVASVLGLGRARVRQGLGRAVRSGGTGHPHRRPRARAADDRRLAARGRRRHAAGRVGPAAPRHARAAIAALQRGDQVEPRRAGAALAPLSREPGRRRSAWRCW